MTSKRPFLFSEWINKICKKEKDLSLVHSDLFCASLLSKISMECIIKISKYCFAKHEKKKKLKLFCSQ